MRAVLPDDYPVIDTATLHEVAAAASDTSPNEWGPEADVPDQGADFVGVSEEADAFAYLYASRNLIPHLAIGLFGDWGSGKSS